MDRDRARAVELLEAEMGGLPVTRRDRVYVTQALRAIEAALQSEGAREWQPIETAPKDGTWFMAAYLMSNGEWRQMVVFWNVFQGEGFWQFGGLKERPTHWQPLPAPPANPVSGELER